jgi:hypothetical protein
MGTTNRAQPRELDLDELPMEEELNEVGRWELPPGRDDDEVGDLVIEGRFIGLGSSEHRTHKDHAGEFAERGGRCGACRWFETRIFKLTDGTGYLIYNVGVSLVPDEHHLVTVERARTPHEVVERYTRRRDGEVYLTTPSARALAQAAGYDDGMEDAWATRVVQ